MTPYEEGYEAYENGDDVTDNPYDFPCWQNTSWQEGFDAAQEYAYIEGA